MAIEIRDAVKKYGRGESEICALDHVNLRIEKGEVCVILGPSGSGKSTLLNMIGGLDRLDAGTVTVNWSNSFCERRQTSCTRATVSLRVP